NRGIRAMPRRALIDHRPWLLASITAAIAYYFLWDNPLGGLWLILLKGAAVGFLTIYAMRRGKGLDGAILTLALALSAAADMVLELNFYAGGALFFVSHVVAISLYLRNRRAPHEASWGAAALAMLLLTPLTTYLLSQSPIVAGYSVGLAGMAAAAWQSRFPRHRVAAGAILFIVSDWLLFSQLGPLDLAPLPDLLVWPLYYAAQLLIATGVVQTLRGELKVR
ncbi:MAG: lysoplasmalogenase family protein, partial [Pseudomonadota bacterium]